MANFWDEYNQRAQQSAMSGGVQDWATFEKMRRIQELSRKKEEESKKPEAKGNLLTSLLPALGGTGGALGGASAGAGIGTAILPGIGTAIGAIGGAILGGAGGSAIGKVGENAAIGEEDLGKGVGEEALWGGITSVPVFGTGLKVAKAGTKVATGIGKEAASQSIIDAGAKVAPRQVNEGIAVARNQGANLQVTQPKSFTQKLAPRAEAKAAELLSTQSNLTRPQMRQSGVDVQSAFGNLNRRTGLTRMDDMAEVASKITGGSDSVLDNLTQSAIGNAGVRSLNDVPGVDVGDLRTLADKLLTDKAPLISDSRRQNVLNQVKNSSVAMNGGSAGSINPLASPTEALAQANNFDAMAASLTNGFNTTPEAQQLANVYKGLSSAIKDKLYNAPGVAEGLSMAKPEAIARLNRLAAEAPNGQQAAAYKALASELETIEDIGKLRSSKKDFVDLSKIDKATAQAQNGAGQQVGDTLTGVGRFVQRPTNMLAVPLNAATPTIAGKIAQIARTARGQGTVGQKTTQSILPLAGREFVGTNIADVSQATPQASTEDSVTAELETLLADPSLNEPVQPTEPSNQFGISANEVAQGMVRALAAGDEKAFSQLKELHELVSATEKEEKINSATQKALTQSANADSTLLQLESMLENAGGASGPLGGRISSFFGDIGLNNDVKAYDDLVMGSTAQIAKALGETGALSDADRAAYAKLLPKVTDTPEVAAIKFAALRERMNSAKQNTMQYGGGSSLEDILAGSSY